MKEEKWKAEERERERERERAKAIKEEIFLSLYMLTLPSVK